MILNTVAELPVRFSLLAPKSGELTNELAFSPGRLIPGNNHIKRRCQMEQITADELSADLSTIFDRVSRNHEIFSVIWNKNQAVVILDAEEYKRLAKQNYPELIRKTSQDRKIHETFSDDSDTLILSALHAGRISESYRLLQKHGNTENAHPLSESLEKATGIMKQHRLTDKDIGQAVRVLSDLLREQGIRIQSADFSVRTYKEDEWIHYNFHLDLAKSELLPGLETELNERLSSLPPEMFEALEIDITADGADVLCMTEDISDVITSNDGLMQRINEARQGMREGVAGLSYEEIFGD